MKLTQLLDAYINKRLKGKSKNTVRLYKHSISSFSRTIGREPEMSDLTDDNIERHMWRIVQKGGSPASANKDHGQLTALWRFASNNRMVNTWPNVRTMQEVERVPMGWMPEECNRLLAAARNEGGFIGTVPARIWWESLLKVLFDTGERIGAIRGLQHEHLQSKWLLVPAALRKGNKSDKLYELQADTVALMRVLIEKNTDDTLMFPWDRCETYIYNRYKGILKRAKLPSDRRSCFHRIRRTLCSAVAASGGDASAALGHSSPRTTKRYLDPRIVGGVKPSEIMAAFLRTPPEPPTPPDEKRKQA
jgi:integrase